MESRLCQSCGEEICDYELSKCFSCGAELSFDDTCKEQGIFDKLSSIKDQGLDSLSEIFNPKDNEVNQILLTTAPSVAGFKIEETIEIVTAECVLGMNFFKDIEASFSDFFGGRSGAAQKVLRGARKTCLYELKKEASDVGANAVIAVKLDYNEFSGKGKSMLFLVASGTAVKISKINKE